MITYIKQMAIGISFLMIINLNDNYMQQGVIIDDKNSLNITINSPKCFLATRNLACQI